MRGSIPVPGQSTIGYGGNTSCVELRADGEIIVLDAGSGIRPLGLSLDREFGERPIKLTMLLTHSHWDHIQGLPFFLPAYQKKNEIHILGYEGASNGLAAILSEQMENPFFPVKLHDVFGCVAIRELKEMEFQVGQVRIAARFVNHPGNCSGFRLFTSGGSVAYLPDNEPFEHLRRQMAERENASIEQAASVAREERDGLVQFLSGTDVLLLDTQYTDEEYPEKVGWGHGHISATISLALDAGVKRLLLFHHDPNHDDAFIDGMVKTARRQVAESGRALTVEAAREGDEIVLDRRENG